MSKKSNGLNNWAKSNKGGIIISLLIGLAFLLPHLLIPLIQEPGTYYSPLVAKGVDARTIDENFYAGFVKEVTEGNIFPQSHLYEWKGNFQFSHVGTPLPAWILGAMTYLIGIKWAYIFSIFIFTLLGSILTYYFIEKITNYKILSIFSTALLFFSPTYILKFFTDNITQPLSYFSRFYAVLVDYPFFILGIIALYFFLQNKSWKLVFFVGIIGGALFYIYFYYWTFYLVLLSLVGLYFLIKDRKQIHKVIVAFLILILVALPFILSLINTGDSTSDLVVRHTTDFNYSPDWGITLFLFFVILVFYLIWKFTFKNQTPIFEKEPIVLIFTLLFSSIIIMNVQVILGFTVSSRHWLTTAIWPVLIFTGSVSLVMIKELIDQTNFKTGFKKYYSHCLIILTLLLLVFGFIWQINFSFNTSENYYLTNEQLELFDWLNKNTFKNSVVLSLSSENLLLLPIYTHNNNFLANAVVDPVPLSEVIHRRLLAYKILGVEEKDFDFIKDPCAANKLLKKGFENEKGAKYNYSLFEPAFSNMFSFHIVADDSCEISPEIKNKIYAIYDKLPEEPQNLIKKFKLDYILISEYENNLLNRELNVFCQLVYSNQGYQICKLK